MACSIFFLIFSLVSLLLMSKLLLGAAILQANGCPQQCGNHSKLFVFGDSYADTGNLGQRLGRNIARSWFPPYGMSFPHKPTGRFSDGRVLTDFVASSMRIGSPVPYRMRRAPGASQLASYGMNFAVAGSGVFDTGNFQRNLALQIDQFESQIDSGVFSGCDVRASAALVAVSGNDYLHLAQRDPHYLLHLDRFMSALFAELKRDLKRLERLGVGRVMVTNLHPVGCTPYYTRPTNYTRCSADVSSAVAEHNRRLRELMSELGRGGAASSFFGLDVHGAISSLLRQAEKFGKPLAPCCESRGEGDSCGQVDEEGKEVYRVCGRPEEHLYWDAVHPTQAAWAAAFEFLRLPVQNILRF
ncbi:GDSL esterase/lipase At5g03610-like [Zingiber officinale]|uniref:GDSL esterase/lipase At5g03610-like n=1 Tax=Zingiber officinale TaxID=94328 RepID=UPI001C4C321B|nr:GDSL esterase/lipase At5g03610-like [Zingiber officinale]